MLIYAFVTKSSANLYEQTDEIYRNSCRFLNIFSQGPPDGYKLYGWRNSVADKALRPQGLRGSGPKGLRAKYRAAGWYQIVPNRP